jgi:uncharacterized membrane protein YjgN (DUF898 family)
MDRIKLRFGQAVGLKELIATLVVSGVLLIVGTVVFAKVKASMGTDLEGDANDTVNNVEETTYEAFELATVALIVCCLTVVTHGIQPIVGSCCYHRYFNQSIRCVRLNKYVTLLNDCSGFVSANPWGQAGNGSPFFFSCP